MSVKRYEFPTNDKPSDKRQAIIQDNIILLISDADYIHLCVYRVLESVTPGVTVCKGMRSEKFGLFFRKKAV